MASSRKSKLVAALLGLSALGACAAADYDNHWDTVSFRAGNAMAHNSGVHVISQWPAHVDNTTIPHGR